VKSGGGDGDLIFSFVATRIVAIGIAASYCYESPKPPEFGQVGMNWERVGWRVQVRFTRLSRQIRPKDHIDLLRGSLPPRYSPLRPNSDGLQGAIMAELLIQVIGPEASEMVAVAEQANGEISTQVGGEDIDMWEHHLEQEVEQNWGIDVTERSALDWLAGAKGCSKNE